LTQQSVFQPFLQTQIQCVIILSKAFYCQNPHYRTKNDNILILFRRKQKRSASVLNRGVLQ